MQANELDLALDVYSQLVREGCTPNLVTYNILIDIYGKTAQWQEAIKLLDQLHSQVGPSCYSIAGVRLPYGWWPATCSGPAIAPHSL